MPVPPRFNDLAVGRRALLELLLRKGKSYAELGSILSIEPATLRGRSHDALDVLVRPDGVAPPPMRQAEVADFLLGQQTPAERAHTVAFLRGSEEARAWAELVEVQLAAAGLPTVSLGEQPPAPGHSPTPAFSEPSVVRFVDEPPAEERWAQRMPRVAWDAPPAEIAADELPHWLAPRARAATVRRRRRRLLPAAGLVLAAGAAAVTLALTLGGAPSPSSAPVAAPGARATVGPRIATAPLAIDAVAERQLEIYEPLYRRAARTFGVSWALLASIHQQETELSTAPGTYSGVNFAGCCAGPMQFDIVSPGGAWHDVAESYRHAQRPFRYPHSTATHPSVYDDFDAIMAAAALLHRLGARSALDGRAWSAVYRYHGTNPVGATYADQVVTRAKAWVSRGGGPAASSAG